MSLHFDGTSTTRASPIPVRSVALVVRRVPERRERPDGPNSAVIGSVLVVFRRRRRPEDDSQRIVPEPVALLAGSLNQLWSLYGELRGAGADPQLALDFSISKLLPQDDAERVGLFLMGVMDDEYGLPPEDGGLALRAKVLAEAESYFEETSTDRVEESTPQTDAERRANVLRIMQRIDSSTVPPVELNLVVVIWSLLASVLRGDPDCPAASLSDIPPLLHECLGDALNTYGDGEPDRYLAPGIVEEWHRAVARGLREIASGSDGYRRFQRDVEAGTLTPDVSDKSVEDLGRDLFVAVMAPLLRAAEAVDAPPRGTVDTNLAELVYDIAVASLNAEEGELSDGSLGFAAMYSDTVTEDLRERYRIDEQAWLAVRLVAERVADAPHYRFGPHGLDWWGEKLRQRLSVHSTPGDPAGCWISARTKVVAEVSADPELVLELLSDVNAECGAEALVWDPQSRSVFSASDVWADDEDTWLLVHREMAGTSMQALEARSELLVDALTGMPVDEPHPSGVGRPASLSLFEHARTHASSRRPWPMEPADFERMASMPELADRRTTVGDTGLTTEVELDGWPNIGSGPDTALLTISAEGEVAPRVLTGARHRLGPGLLVRLLLPANVPPHDGYRIANALNAADGRLRSADRLGAWYWEHDTIGYCSYITGETVDFKTDEVAFRVSRRLVVGTLRRARWAGRRPELLAFRP